MLDIRLNSPLQFLKGVGPRKAEILGQYGIHEVADLLACFPRQYLDRTSVVPIDKAEIDQAVTVIGQVKAHGMLYGKGRRYEVTLEDDSGGLSLLWFHSVRYWEKLFKKGQWFAATGTIGYYQGRQMIHPDLERLEDDSSQMIHAGRIIPVYPQTSELNKVGLNSKGIRRLTSVIVENLTERLPDPIPKSISKKFGLLERHEAAVKIHFPESREQVEVCRRRLAFDELLVFQYLINCRRAEKQESIKPHKYAAPGKKLVQFGKDLPFKLTDGQAKVSKQIIDNLQSNHPMTRMLQGDVGSGKTVVAVLAALFAAENRLQTAIMVPTEILAEQHHRTWSEALAKVGVRSAVLTSSLKAAEKKERARQCAEGEIDILFGTHALIYDYVSFKKLGLVVIDEQHRFGVEQRGKLQAKGDNPDLLVMTATPIPRTMALTLYGDLDISTIKGLPPGRKPIRTVWRTKDVRDKVYQFLRDEVSAGGQAYIVYPLVEKSELIDLESVEEAYAKLSKDAFKDIRVGMVHGKMKAAVRDETLSKFRNGELDVLMATTVIEVGIDNPNASFMMIEHAERFGLAQLHQLRGRIGRGEKQSTLVAIAHTPISDIARQRLEYFVSTTDGFEIAEADLELRGPGEMFGVKQSGVPEFRMVKLGVDADLIEQTKLVLQPLFDNREKLTDDMKRLNKYLESTAGARRQLLGAD